jgi:two-component system, cell cycle sensor histidine kinase PleC
VTFFDMKRIPRLPIARWIAPLDDQSHTVLGLVCAFVIVFSFVSLTRIMQEYGKIQDEIVADRARVAVFLAQRSYTHLRSAQAALQGAGSAIEVDVATGRADIFGHLSALKSRDDLGPVALFDSEGRVRGSTDTSATPLLALASRLSQGRTVWVLSREDLPQPFIFLAAPVNENGDRLVAQFVAPAGLPGHVSEGEPVLLVHESGRVLAHSMKSMSAEPLDAATALGLSALPSFRTVDGGAEPTKFARYRDPSGARVLATAEVIEGLNLYYAAPFSIPASYWYRAMAFFVLMTMAPILVAVGLCSVLFGQMASTRQMRQALTDSERRFRLAVDGANCGVWDWDLATDQVFLTDSLARMLGRSASGQFKANEFLSLIREEDRELVRVGVRSALSRGEVDIEFRSARLPVWLHLRGRPWTSSDGSHSSRLMGVAIDVTAHRGSQQRIRAYEARLKAALESMSESFVLWDAKRRLVLSNPKFREFFHLDEKLVKPGASYEMLGLAAQGAISSYHEREDDQTGELQLIDGRWLHLSERKTSDGGLVSIGTDITALKRQENQLLESERQLRQTISDLRKTKERLADLANKYEQEKIRAEDANRSKSEFLANMSHELRTPLNAINGFSEIMSEEMFGPLGDGRYKEYSQDILHSGQHLLDLINDILDMSKIEAGKMSVTLEEVQPRTIIEQSARLLRGRARESGLEIVLDMEETPSIMADTRALKQVLLNLTSNAIKFTPEGGRVTISLRGDPDYLSFQVQDTGIGIAKEELPRLGQPFEQVESQHSKAHQGTGLGLALSKSLVELHGGYMMIDSDLGKGTTVSFVIPFDRNQTVENAELRGLRIGASNAPSRGRDKIMLANLPPLDSARLDVHNRPQTALKSANTSKTEAAPSNPLKVSPKLGESMRALSQVPSPSAQSIRGDKRADANVFEDADEEI